MSDSRLPALLGLLLVLGALRFGIVPWAQSQDASREELEVLTRRLDRSEGVVQNRTAIVAAREALAANSGSVLARFPASASADQFRLTTQQRVGAVAQAAGVQVTVFDWVLEGRVDDAGLAYGRARIAFEGPLRDVARAHGELEAALPNAAVREVGLQAINPADATGVVRATQTMLVDVFYRRGGAQ